MQRISSWTDLVTVLGRFRYGTIVGGVSPTPIKAEWLNMVQEEISNVILEAGMALDAEKENQLSQAIAQMMGGFLPLLGGTLTGRLNATKGVRTAKGLPTTNASEVGFAFGVDGDSGLFAASGTDADGSYLVLVIDGEEVSRWNADGSLTIPGELTLAGGKKTYHTGNKPTLLALIYPIGSIYLNAGVATSPADLFGFGTWTQLAPGRLLMGAGTGQDSRGESRTFAGGAVGGEYSHVLSVNEMPAHTHTNPQGGVLGTGGSLTSGDDTTDNVMSNPQSSSTGGNEAHNNMPPYLAVHMWQRTA
ncbi:phage tail protein [uncultured Pseudomonas sp.]|uniref:phage tail protein n=1 Tax=uncultured Pseudomonas sp. TaxID=114707 RepID=UPI00204F8155|nr:hypothetical protein [uncultured Pseudomonas sp.]DAK19331.1 MAG TPA: baseplate wedge protein [Caudoviricetes sp.]